MRLIGVAGWSGSGKTTLIEKLIPCLNARGISVSTVKHAHHRFDVDKPGKDSFRHRQAGALDVLVASSARLALMREHRGGEEPGLHALCAMLGPVDLILVEGFKYSPIPKIEIHRADTGKTLLQADDPWIAAVVSETAPPGLTVPWIPLGDVEGVAEVLIRISGQQTEVTASAAMPVVPTADGPDMPVETALARITSDIRPVCGPESLRTPLADAAGRVLAADVRTRIALPPADCAAVDGYAFAHRDRLLPMPVTARAAAGRPLSGYVAPGGAVRIFTGAALPLGTDTVVMQEQAILAEGLLKVPHATLLGANRRLAGEDVPAGSVVLERGTRINSRHVALAAACGIAALPLLRPLRVAVFSTGDELDGEDGTRDSNRPMLAALLRRLCVTVLDRGILRDDDASVRRALSEAATDADLVVTSGGVSVGEEDHIRKAVAAIGRIDLWRVAMKPGRPLALGRIGQSRFLGLPGSPVAAFIGFVRFGIPLVLCLAGARAAAPLCLVRAGFTFRKKPGRTEYLRARLATGSDGLPSAVLDEDRGAGRLAQLARADALIELGPEVTAVAPGDIVHAIMLADVFG